MNHTTNIRRSNIKQIMKPIQKILYLSNLCGPSVEEHLFKISANNFGQAAQKFNRLLVEGLSMHNECHIEPLSVIPIIRDSYKTPLFKIKSERIGRVVYKYVPFINLPFLKEISIFIYTFINVVFWNLKRGEENKVVLCDILGLSISAGALIACKCTNTKIIAITTDIPGIMAENTNSNILKTITFNLLSKRLITRYCGYILLTEKMNEIVNPHYQPFMILEGMVDYNMKFSVNYLDNKPNVRILIYSGSIDKMYGVKNLIDAFMTLEGADLRLHIYGFGDMKNDMPDYTLMDNRIIYKGIVSNHVMIKKHIKATLLINPRPTNEDYTKYSFPSKNIEYMVSGTPSVTTPLPGIPKEYNNFVYLFIDESVGGISKTLKYLLSKPIEELHKFGTLSKQYVLNNKSNLVQAERVLSFIKENF